MSSFAVLLVLLSCTTHATWNVLTKGAATTPGFFWIANTAVIVVLTPVFLVAGGVEVVRLAPQGLWLCLIATGISQAAYFAFLALAYRHGDMSVVYPVARSFPVFVLLIAGAFLGQWPTLPAYLGIALVVAGCFVLPLERLQLGPAGLSPARYLNPASFWALLTALASSGYTVADDVAMDIVTGLPLAHLSLVGVDLGVLADVRPALLYGYLEWVATASALGVALPFLGGATDLRRVWADQRGRALQVGGLTFGTYLLVLWAYAESEKVAYVAGFRQLSVVLGVVAGILLLGERGGALRVAASATMVLGLVLIALAR